MKPTNLLLLMLLSLTTLSSFNFSPLPAKHLPGEVQSSHVQELFSFLRCHRQGKNIVVNWGVSSVAGVNYFVVYHSDDNGDFYAPLEEIFPDGSLKYTYTNATVFAGTHYYYIQAVMNSGPSVNSNIDVVRIVGR